MDTSVSEQDLLLISRRLREIAKSVEGSGGIPESRQTAVNALTAASNSCDARYLKELLSGLVDACESLAELAPTI